MSKSLRTIQQLQDELDAERVWRLRELSILRKKLLPGISNRNPVTETELALLRPCITMIYGHWEGFVKAACSAYLEYVALQRLTHDEMLPEFLALAARRYATNLGLNGAEADRVMASFFRDQKQSRSFIPYKGGIDTRSNLRFEVFKEIYESLGLSWHAYELKKVMIDTKLVGKRNAIAHGRYIDVQPSDVEELFNSVIELMEQIKDQIFDCAMNSKYKVLVPAFAMQHSCDSFAGLSVCK